MSSGFVYFIKSPAGCYKVGITKRDPERRRREINHPGLVLVKVIATGDPAALERQFHRELADVRLEREWFNIPEEVMERYLALPERMEARRPDQVLSYSSRRVPELTLQEMATKQNGFWLWLREQRRRDDPVGDLARDVFMDRGLSRYNFKRGGPDILRYKMVIRGACQEAMRALDMAQQEWCRIPGVVCKKSPPIPWEREIVWLVKDHLQYEYLREADWSPNNGRITLPAGYRLVGFAKASLSRMQVGGRYMALTAARRYWYLKAHDPYEHEPGRPYFGPVEAVIPQTIRVGYPSERFVSSEHAREVLAQ